MNLNKVKKRLEDIANLNNEEMLTNKEYLVCVANLLFVFGKAGLSSDVKLSGINIEDAAVIELAQNNDPANVFLASILQGHAILYWSSLIGDPNDS